MNGSGTPGRHRLGTLGLVHCLEHRAVSLALSEYRRSWLASLLVPARHSLAGLRRRAVQAASETGGWVPATA